MTAELYALKMSLVYLNYSLFVRQSWTSISSMELYSISCWGSLFELVNLGQRLQSVEHRNNVVNISCTFMYWLLLQFLIVSSLLSLFLSVTLCRHFLFMLSTLCGSPSFALVYVIVSGFLGTMAGPLNILFALHRGYTFCSVHDVILFCTVHIHVVMFCHCDPFYS